MASALLEMALSPFRPSLTRYASSDTAASTVSGGTSSHARYSDASTPPTSAADSESIASAAVKLDNVNDAEADTETHSNPRVLLSGPAASCTPRSRRSRDSVVGTYNIKILSGTAVHAPRKFQRVNNREYDISTRRSTISRDSMPEALGSAKIGGPKPSVKSRRVSVSGINALGPREPVNKLSRSRSPVKVEPLDSTRRCKATRKGDEWSFRRATRSTGAPVESLTTKLSVLGKRGRNKFEAGLIKSKRELRRLADTNEFAKIDTQPVVAEVWSNGKLVTGEEPPKKRVRVESTNSAKMDEDKKAVEKAKPKKRGPKVWLSKGLYAGQEASNLDWFAGYTKEEKKKMANLPEFKPNGLLPLPMWHGQRLLHIGRNFKLPYDVCSPLPPGQPKPDEWRKVPKNRFVGDAAAAWKKSTVFDDFSSRCVCSPANGCDESCQNRIMLYECDDGNCSAGREHCTNRAFADLQERRSKGGKYRIGVEVIKTADRGYGVRSNRCFEPHQIIVEYTGEIITEEECDRRMNEVYKDNECYYLMLFDQNMIIDATRGSIARFVNHSCEPNCRMVKWIVAGKPRMALFAGDRPVMTGEELTYDYNFDPFSAKNVQECRCGSEKCRGVLGPRPKDKPKAPGAIGENMKNAAGAGKRKLDEVLSGEKKMEKSFKKRKITVLTDPSSSRRALSSAKRFKRSISTTVASVITGRPTLIKKESTKTRRVQSYSPKTDGPKKQTYLSSSRKSSLTLVYNRSGKGKNKANSRRSKEMGIKIESDGEIAVAKTVRSIRKRTLSSKRKEYDSGKVKGRVVSGKA